MAFRHEVLHIRRQQQCLIDIPGPKILAQRGTADRLDPQGMHGSYRDIWRTPSAPRAAVVHGLLQRHAHSPVIEQGRANIARRRKRGTHYLSSDPGRTAPSIWPDVIYGRHRIVVPYVALDYTDG